MKTAKFVALQLLRAYKWAISPMLGPACRYVPTCSEYAMEAVERYGVVRGGWRALGRVLRCHPFAGAGYDPVVRPAAQEPLRKSGAGVARTSVPRNGVSRTGVPRTSAPRILTR